ncbi:MAG: tRNA (adenosine(37)-N6)-threonylcarbamoyltransferase complex ATPase subunit type 1 TsaE [Planctomycetaceae bacterium]
MAKFPSRSEDETRQIGATLAAALAPGDVVALIGDLGAGKTRLVQAVAEALGVDRADVTSPTFVLIQEYDGRIPLYHFDTYRLNDLDEFLELGAEELFEGDGVCLVEWADRVADALPADHLRCEIAIAGEQQRILHFTATGPRSQRIVDMLVSSLQAAGSTTDEEETPDGNGVQ